MIALPNYIDREAWTGFEDMRRAIKKPLTPRAAKLILYELQRIKDAGHDANAALDQSTNHCWADVYPPKDKPIEPAKSAESDRTAKYLDDARRAAEDSQTPQAVAAKRAAMDRIRMVR